MNMNYRISLVWGCFLLFVLGSCTNLTTQPNVTAVTTPFPLTPLPTATRSSGTPTPNPLVAAPYDACHAQRRSPKDFTLFPAGTCDEGECIDAGFEAAAYAAWQAEMMQTHQLTTETFDEHIQIANVHTTSSGNRVMVIIDYVVVNEWARTYQSDILSFSEEPNTTQLAKEAEQTVFETTQINLPQVSSVETIAATFASCAPNLEINWCYLDYPNFGGRLYVTAFQTIDLDTNKCQDAAVYIDTGELWYCRERPCMIDE